MRTLFPIALQIVCVILIVCFGMAVPVAMMSFIQRSPPQLADIFSIGSRSLHLLSLYVAASFAFFVTSMILIIATGKSENGHIELSHRSVGTTMLQFWCAQNVALAMLSLVSLAYLCLR